ncbi:hypothetical protein [Arthrobacter sp. ISL-65]|uniref:hypothetical protein n=1 Tax=Arthrobacter sp. ISL-65 TaxID=2819112 RepID=UPI001BE64A56|nr:hypothetical protein [Arthrobacter sp. ISL-65]MBT2549752.1 hypothetical protein [Arthrobacter sp. ISL-65]
MSTLQSRVSRGIPAGGQFAAAEHSEPTLSLAPGTDPQVLRNLNRAISPIPEITEAQEERLRGHKTPLLNAFKRKGITKFARKAKLPVREETGA